MSSTDPRTARPADGGTPGALIYQVRGHFGLVTNAALSELPTSHYRLSPRALGVYSVVRRFRLVAASQILRLAFHEGSDASRERRMRRTMEKQLWKRGLVKRLPRAYGTVGGGSEGYVYQPYDPSRQGFRSAHPHTLMITEIYIRMIEAERAGRCELIAFDPEEDVQVGHLEFTPDAMVDVRTPTGRYRYWLEVDLGSERGPALKKRIDKYTKAKDKWPDYFPTGPDKTFPKVVWVVENTKRASELWRLIKKYGKAHLFDVCLFDETVDLLTR